VSGRLRFTVWGGIVLGVVCFAYFLHDIRWDELLEVLKATRIGYVVLALFFSLAMYFVRAVRWRLLLDPVVQISFSRALSFTFIGFGTNVLLPARAGEFIKAFLVKREADSSVSSVLATIVLERIFDLIVLLGILAVVLTQVQATTTETMEMASSLAAVGYVFFAITVVAMLVLCCLARWPDATQRLLAVVLMPLPTWASERVLSLLETFVHGLGGLKSLRVLVGVFFWSLVLWGTSFGVFWSNALALGFDLGLLGASLVLVTVAFAVALPQAPGFIGPYQIACAAAATFLGFPVSHAKGFALISWLLSAVPVALITLVLLGKEGLSLGAVQQAGNRLRGQASEESV